MYEFTTEFSLAAAEIENRKLTGNPRQVVTIDGGPHTLWWPTQSAAGNLQPESIPPPQLIRELQPEALFLITLQDPVARMYSDYHFLDDSMRPHHLPKSAHLRNSNSNIIADEKNPHIFHERVVKQVRAFRECVEGVTQSNKTHCWFRASQECAHDRSRFAVAGWGRLSIGLYVLFLEKWLEHFSLSKFLVLRLEDYEKDPQKYMERVFSFLDLEMPSDWSSILHSGVANKHKDSRDPMLPETLRVLKDFYSPYNRLLAKLLKNDGFLWSDDVHPLTLHLEEGTKLVSNPENAHGVGERSDSEYFAEPRSSRQPAAARLRRARPSYQDDFKEFSLEGLPQPLPQAELNEMTFPVVDLKRAPSDVEKVGKLLCISAFALDLVAIKTILLEWKAPANAKLIDEFERNAFHCLAHVGLNIESHSNSHIFHMLHGSRGYLTDILNPSLPDHVMTTIGPVILRSLERPVMNIAEWLLRAGADPTLADINGLTPLHLACQAGFLPLVRFFIRHGANVNSKTLKEQRSPLHIAAAYGHTEVLGLLVSSGGALDDKDYCGVSPRDIASSAGPIRPEDSQRYLNISQRPPKLISRPLFPHIYSASSLNRNIVTSIRVASSNYSESKVTIGGYDSERLSGFENDVSCDIDQYDADEITGQKLFQNYFSQNKPVLIRGLINEWPAVLMYERSHLKISHGDLTVKVSSIPYSVKFNGDGSTEMTLAQYMDQVETHKMVGGSHPWYVFIGHPLKVERHSKIKARAPPNNSHLVDYDLVPTPHLLHEAFEMLTKGPNTRISDEPNQRADFVNAQWAYGGAGTGAPVHYHNMAWYILLTIFFLVY